MNDIKIKINELIEKGDMVALCELLKKKCEYTPEDLPIFGGKVHPDFVGVDCISFEEMEELCEHFYN